MFSFVAVGALWRTPRLAAATTGRPLPDWVQRVADAPAVRGLLRSLGVVALAALLAVAAFGPDNSGTNPAPTWLYVWFWIGLIPASLLFGPAWRLCNPLRAVTAAVAALTGDRDEVGVRPLPVPVGYWPAAAGLTAFVWLELVYPDPDSPTVVLVFTAAYALVHVAGGLVFGQAWFARCDGFEVYSSLLARLAPVGRRADSRLVLRNPLHGLAGLRVDPSLTAVVYVLLGATVFDGLTSMTWWEEAAGATSGLGYLRTGTTGLVIAIGLVAVTFSSGTRLAGRLASRTRLPLDPRTLPEVFAHSLVPIAVGYSIAHYFALAVFQGQAGYILASDPFGSGVDLLGTAGWRIDYTAVSAGTIAVVQVLAIVVGHVLGVVAAHDRSVALFARPDTRRAQYPLLAVMVLYTCGGIALLLGA